ncbi:DUF2325 domain-containing protein [Paraburkholderia sp. NMBU_R16]|uniref:DUF2325 domain-containing protein n=1 Tax=Paraburkholderia sp. NMBU_R16 TaxID=2698676 RepID=UPI00349F42A6
MLKRALCRKRILYVGGWRSNNATLSKLVRRAGGEFTHHSGLVDERRCSEFAMQLCDTDLVLCPLDVLDADSLIGVRRLCADYRVRWLPLRSSNVASFIAGIMKAGEQKRTLRTNVCPYRG